jgi:hypothetical protein
VLASLINCSWASGGSLSWKPGGSHAEAVLSLFAGLAGLVLGVLGLSDAAAGEKYRLVWPLLFLTFCISVLLVGVFKAPTIKKVSKSCIYANRILAEGTALTS